MNEAKRLKNNYTARLERLRRKTTLGDKNSARKMISVLAEYNIALRNIGYRTTGENESYRPGSVIPITKEWIISERKKEIVRKKILNSFKNCKTKEDKIKAIHGLLFNESRYDL